MDFGPVVTPSPDASAAAWIPPRLNTAPGLHDPWGVGYFVPEGFEQCLFVDDITEDLDDWWETQKAHTATTAAVAARHTTTPERAYFAVCDVHGYPTSGLTAIPKFANPEDTRAYYLLQGAVASVVDILVPGRRRSDEWRQPDLWWPEDRAWIVCTDVDFWCNYVAGTADLVADIAAAVGTETHLVERSDPLERVD